MNKNKIYLWLIALVFGLNTEGVYAQAAINTDGSAPDAKAMLDIKSTDKGVLLPRMSTAQRTAIAPTATQKGLLVYDNTTSSVWQWNGTAWAELGAAAASVWTTKNDSSIYTSKKQVGINNDDPRAALHVMGGGFIVQGKQKVPLTPTAVNTYTMNASGISSNTSPTPDSVGIIKSHSSAGTANYGGGTNTIINVDPKSGTATYIIGVRLTFTHFNTEATNDTVIIKDRYNDNAKNIVFSGATLPAVFEFSSSNISSGFRVKFQENNSATLGTGFILKYEFIYADNNNTVIGKSVGNGFMYDVGKDALVMGDVGRADAQIGFGSVALGSSTASGGYSTASGYNSTASGYYSSASGYNSTVSGNYSTASGYYSTASGGFSTAWGFSSTASGGFSTAWGFSSTASGYGSYARGELTVSNSAHCTVIGCQNAPIVTTPQINYYDWNLTDPLFIIGNGNPISGNLSNALTILKNGNMGMGSVIAPTFRIEIPNIAASDGQGKANAWVTYSDNRVKFNQKPLQYGLSHIMQMQVKSYDHYSSEFKNGALVLSSSKPTFGLIAQELYKIIPEMVNKPTDESKDLWSIDYDKFGPLLVKTVQEQQAQIEDLKQQIATLNTLKADVEMLKAALQTGDLKKGGPSVFGTQKASTERK
jgi:hypothetical protein